MMNSLSSATPTSFLQHLKTTSSSPPSSLVRFKFNPTKPKASFSSSNQNHNPPTATNHSRPLKSLTHAAIFLGVTASLIGRFSNLPPLARAESPAIVEDEQQQLEQEQEREGEVKVDHSSPVSEFVESNIESLKSLLQQKLENGEDEEALNILKRMVCAQPQETEWKFLMARLLNEMGQTKQARQMFEEILSDNPLSFEALFENALLMDRCGEGEAVIGRLEEALTLAEEENKVKEARDVRLIMAQIQFLQKNVETALMSYQQLAKEDPLDFRPYFCQGMIYSLLHRAEEANQMFTKYRELSPKKFEVEGYLRTPLSRIKIFGTDEQN